VVTEELAAQRLTHDIYSNAQLQEVMTRLLAESLNVYLHKNDQTPYILVVSEGCIFARSRWVSSKTCLRLPRTAGDAALLIRLQQLGRFTAARKSQNQGSAPSRHTEESPEGLNENYARELMELHTLGVNGGYTQADVTQVARVLTGWTVDRPQRGGGFKFDENRHEPGTKKVLGKKIRNTGS